MNFMNGETIIAELVQIIPELATEITDNREAILRKVLKPLLDAEKPMVGYAREPIVNGTGMIECGMDVAGNVLKIGDQVWTPAGSSDPACAVIVALYPTSWPSIPPSAPEISCLLDFDFGGGRHMYDLVNTKQCGKAI